MNLSLGRERGGGTWPCFPPPLGSPGTSLMEAPHLLRAGAPLKPRELARALPCSGTQQKFWIRRWRAEGGKASKEVGMGGKRRTLAGWEGDLVIRIAGRQHLLPAGSQTGSAGSSRGGWWSVPCLVKLHLWQLQGSPSAMPGSKRKAVS